MLTALDFGCGAGRVISHSLNEGIGDFWGADTYYGDGEITARDEHETIPPATRERIRLLEPGRPLPYDDDSFDFVCSNQVFEHVDDLAGTIDELARVTRPGGVHLHLFPTLELLREAHLGVPLIHRLPVERREAWAKLFYPHAYYADTTSSFDDWWKAMGPFLAERTFYRPRAEYDTAFARRFQVTHVEQSKLAFHLGQSRLRPLRALAHTVPTTVELLRVGTAVHLRLPITA
ncbi:methyltransferase family protein [Actinocrispum wychmicini]|uniref:Methyltransferase family protein n=1 Tax=Actinocrispum wychmicini TaxID=1213861 RepID=A0A4R2JU37_9PSEU|nr:methyltransferase family protein [Actinocrispum wychmicini]